MTLVCLDQYSVFPLSDLGSLPDLVIACCLPWPLTCLLTTLELCLPLPSDYASCLIPGTVLGHQLSLQVTSLGVATWEFPAAKPVPTIRGSGEYQGAPGTLLLWLGSHQNLWAIQRIHCPAPVSVTLKWLSVTWANMPPLWLIALHIFSFCPEYHLNHNLSKMYSNCKCLHMPIKQCTYLTSSCICK